MLESYLFCSYRHKPVCRKVKKLVQDDNVDFERAFYRQNPWLVGIASVECSHIEGDVALLKTTFSNQFDIHWYQIVVEGRYADGKQLLNIRYEMEQGDIVFADVDLAELGLRELYCFNESELPSSHEKIEAGCKEPFSLKIGRLGTHVNDTVGEAFRIRWDNDPYHPYHSVKQAIESYLKQEASRYVEGVGDNQWFGYNLESLVETLYYHALRSHKMLLKYEEKLSSQFPSDKEKRDSLMKKMFHDAYIEMLSLHDLFLHAFVTEQLQQQDSDDYRAYLDWIEVIRKYLSDEISFVDLDEAIAKRERFDGFKITELVLQAKQTEQCRAFFKHHPELSLPPDAKHFTSEFASERDSLYKSKNLWWRLGGVGKNLVQQMIRLLLQKKNLRVCLFNEKKRTITPVDLPEASSFTRLQRKTVFTEWKRAVVISGDKKEDLLYSFSDVCSYRQIGLCRKYLAFSACTKETTFVDVQSLKLVSRDQSRPKHQTVSQVHDRDLRCSKLVCEDNQLWIVWHGKSKTHLSLYRFGKDAVAPPAVKISELRRSSLVPENTKPKTAYTDWRNYEGCLDAIGFKSHLFISTSSFDSTKHWVVRCDRKGQLLVVSSLEVDLATSINPTIARWSVGHRLMPACLMVSEDNRFDLVVADSRMRLFRLPHLTGAFNSRPRLIQTIPKECDSWPSLFLLQTNGSFSVFRQQVENYRGWNTKRYYNYRFI